MTSPVVREAMRDAVAAALPMGWRLADVENVAPDIGAGERWAVVAFTPSGDDRITLGPRGRFRETGSVDVGFYVPAGEGVDDAIEAAEGVRQACAGLVALGGLLRVVDTMPAAVLSGGAPAGLFADVSVVLFFAFDHFKG